MSYPRNALGFEVWVESEWFGVKFSQCMAAFYYWQEALDFKDYCLKSGKPVVIRTLQPTGDAWRSEIRATS